MMYHRFVCLVVFLYVFILFSLGLCCCLWAFFSWASQGYSSLGFASFSLWRYPCCRAQALGVQASVVVVHGPSSRGSWALARELRGCGPGLSCSEARGIFPDQGLNPCHLHCRVDSYPGKSSDWLLSLISMHLTFLFFSWLDRIFVSSLNDIPLFGCRPVYPFTY